MSYDNNLTGALFKNEEKTPANPTWADYKGECEVDGQKFWLSGWLKKDRNGKTFMSLSLKPKGERVGKASEDSAKTEARFKQSVKQHFPDDSDLPF